jgi:hypothetical protein
MINIINNSQPQPTMDNQRHWIDHRGQLQSQATTKYNVRLNFNIIDNRKPTTANQQRLIDDQYNQHLSTTTNHIGLINTTNNRKPTTVNQQQCLIDDQFYKQQRQIGHQ